MRHVAAHRLADVAMGKIGERERERIARHVADCTVCAGRSERLARARGAMNEIAAQQAPELGWDRIDVRLYWENSTARHALLRRRERSPWPRRIALGVTGGAVLAMGAFAAIAMLRSDDASSAVRPAPQAAVVAPRTAAPSAMRGVVTFARGDLTFDGAPVDLANLFERPIVAGTRLGSSERGRIVVQFGHESGFALGPGSALHVRRFDDRGVELEVLEGSIEVEVTRRRSDQSFEVIAGRHRVSVRGTAFRVEKRNGELDVTCAHGRVVVTDGQSEVALDAGQELHLLRELVLARALRQQVDPEKLAELESTLAGRLLPAWTEPSALADTSSILAVGAAAGREVRLDGVDVGEGSFVLRVMSGRHKLQVADVDGDFGAGTWVEATPGVRRSVRAGQGGAVRIGDGTAGTVQPAGPSFEDTHAARKARRAQLVEALDGSRQALQCMEPLQKRDLVAGSFVVFDVGINADGSQGHLNVAESNVPAEVERCLRRVVDAVELPSGPAATVRYEMSF